MRKNKIIPLLVLSLGVAGSCDHSNNKNLYYTITDYQYNESGCNPGTQPCLLVNISYPVFSGNDSLANQINFFIGNGILDIMGLGDVEANTYLNFDKSIDQLQKNFNRLKNDFQDYGTGWTVSIQTIPIFSGDTIEVFAVESMTFFGGAHPNTNRRYYNIATSTGKILKYDDLGTNLVDLKIRAEKLFRQQNNLSEEELFNDRGYLFPNNEFVLSANFGIRSDSIILYYNLYEIAPYTGGPTELIMKLKP